LSSCDQCSRAKVNKFFKVAWFNYFKKVYIYVYSPQSFKKRNDERVKTAAGNREDVKYEKAQKAQKKEKEKMLREKEEERLKEEKKKKGDEYRDKRYEKRQSVYNNWEMSKRLENDLNSNICN